LANCCTLIEKERIITASHWVKDKPLPGTFETISPWLILYVKLTQIGTMIRIEELLRKKKKILYHFISGWREPLENMPTLIPALEKDRIFSVNISLPSPPQVLGGNF
jgi:hypothetical protein